MATHAIGVAAAARAAVRAASANGAVAEHHDGGVAYGVRRYLQAGGVRGDHARFVLVDVADWFARVPRVVLVRFLEPRGSSAQRAVEERFTAGDAEAGKANRRRFYRFYPPRRIRASRDRARVPSPRAARTR